MERRGRVGLLDAMLKPTKLGALLAFTYSHTSIVMISQTRGRLDGRQVTGGAEAGGCGGEATREEAGGQCSRQQLAQESLERLENRVCAQETTRRFLKSRTCATAVLAKRSIEASEGKPGLMTRSRLMLSRCASSRGGKPRPRTHKQRQTLDSIYISGQLN